MTKEEFYNEFKEWTKEEMLSRAYDICLKNIALQQRTEEAVDYINKKWEEHTYYERNENHLGFCEFSEFEKTDLLNILNGRSDE